MNTEIKEKRMLSVIDWNNEVIANKNYILVYTLGNGSMIDIPRKRGYVIQKRHIQGGEKSHFYLSKEKALLDYNSNQY